MVNFSLFAPHAKNVSLESTLTIPMERTGDIWHISVENPETRYRFRVDGKIVIDPYARSIDGEWGLLDSEFDWKGDKHPKIPLEDLIIYELHLRSFTIQANVKHPGTYLGLIEKIDYLLSLGINAVELLPIFSFEHGKNYWGYAPISFFAPERLYAVKDPISEFREMVRQLHSAGIEVILDVVYNHTGPCQLQTLAPEIYYLKHDYSGCGNSLNANHPVVQQLILDSLRYWVSEMHVDGFRFDLASILTRGENGEPLETAPIIDAISKDPLLKDVKLIAEPWDAAGLYQLGKFPKSWMEWNGYYRDSVRSFIRGDGNIGEFAKSISGSDHLYDSPLSSINFITCHDGFTLSDLVSYNEKHNEENGEGNRDGFDTNLSWNCGVEGETDDIQISNLRERQMQNLISALMVSLGVPMLQSGDEYGQSKSGNNNSWCHDNELNWFDWKANTLPFFRELILLRKKFSKLKHLKAHDITWFDADGEMPDWSQKSSFLAFCLKKSRKPQLFVAFNASKFKQRIKLPKGNWLSLIDKKSLSSHCEIFPYSALLLEVKRAG